MENLGGYCIDSEILIDYLRGIKDARAFLLRESNRAPLYISVVSIAEIYSGQDTKDPKKREQIEKFLQSFTVIDVGQIIAVRAGKIRRDQGKPFADAIVAASAVFYRLKLATRNTKHFRSVKDLEVFRPY